MDLDLTPELLAIRERARRFCDEWLIPFERECEELGSLSRASHERIHAAVIEHDLNAMNMPTEWGGQGFGVLAQVVALEQLGRVTNALWAAVWRPAQVLEHCTPDQRERYLLPEIAGSRRYAYAITEEHAGSDPSKLQTTAVRVDGGYRLNGEKWFVTDADIADYLIVVAEVAEAGQTCFLVPLAAPGLRETRRPRYMHTFAFQHPEYVLEDVFVADADVLGAVGKGNEISKEWFLDERLMIAARCLGGAERALETALAYANDRVQFGQPIIEFQGTGFQLADSAVEIAATRALTYQVAWELDRGALDPKTAHAKASTIKLYASEMAGRVVDRSVQVLGGRGYMRENPVERLYRDLRVDRIWEGTSEIQRVVIVNELRKRGLDGITAWPGSS